MSIDLSSQIRYLLPSNCEIFVGKYDSLHIAVKGDITYGGIYAAYAFPVAYTDKYISIMHNTGACGDYEIGMIRDLADFPTGQADLIRQALSRRYFMHIITLINSISWKKDLVRFDVETNKGPAKFLMKWENENAVDYGKKGKVIIDIHENQFLVPDVNALPDQQRNDFTRVIYW